MITGQEGGIVLITSRWSPSPVTSTSQSLTFNRKRGNITGSITGGNTDGLGGFSRSGLRSSGGAISDPGLGNLYLLPPHPLSYQAVCQGGEWMAWSNGSVNRTRPTGESWSSWWRSSKISRWEGRDPFTSRTRTWLHIYTYILTTWNVVIMICMWCM